MLPIYLATEARDKVANGDMRAHSPSFYTGTVAAAQNEGRLCTTHLKTKISFQLYAHEMREYVCNKYCWEKNTFNSIYWDAQVIALQRFTPMQCITVIKLAHGWLATKQQRYRAGNSTLLSASSVITLKTNTTYLRVLTKRWYRNKKTNLHTWSLNSVIVFCRKQRGKSKQACNSPSAWRAAEHLGRNLSLT